jgi:hypothetical protein
LKTRNIFAFFFSFAFLFSCKKESTQNTQNTKPENVLDSGMIAYYPFNGNGADKSRNNYNLTIVGPTLTADRFGNANAAYKFNGQYDYMVIPGLLKADSVRQFTISMWVKAESITYNTMLSMRSVNGNLCSTSISLGPEGSSFVLRSEVLLKDAPDNCNVSVFSNSLINPSGRWHQLVLVQTYLYGTNEPDPRYMYDQYYDGIKFSRGTSGTGSNPKAASFLNGGIIGGHNNSGNYEMNFDMFNGDIDEVRIYNRALSSVEVSQLFALKN